MSKKIKYVLGIMVTLTVATYAQWKFKCSACAKEVKESQATASETSEATSPINAFSFSKNGVGYICNDNFRFLINGYTFKLPVSDSLNQGIEQLISYLENHPTERARIIGIAMSEEENTSIFPNLGVARANQVKNYITRKGVLANRLDIAGKTVDAWDRKGNLVKGPINIELIPVPGGKNTNWKALRNQLNQNPLSLKFSPGQSAIELSFEQREMILELTKYLDNVAGSMVSIVGHTDNVGDRLANLNLGLERAEFAKAYLVKNGIAADRIEALSKGPDEPIADNSLESGRAMNRRTVVVLK